MDAIAAIDELVKRASHGDAEAFGAVIAHYYDFIYRTAYKWCGMKSDAEDVAQDVAVKLAGAIRQFDGRSAFSSWLYRVTLNAVRDRQREAGRNRRRTDALALVADDAAPPEQEEAVAMGELWAAVRRLPPQQRDAVLLVYAEEMSHAAAGDVLGCKEATVSWHIHEAKKTLRGLL